MVYIAENYAFLAKLPSIQEIVKIHYLPHHNLAITKLTDEYNNTCNFDFKNLCKVTTDGTVNSFFNVPSPAALDLVTNFTQINGTDILIKYTSFNIQSSLDNCTVTENTRGIFDVTSNISNLHFKDVS
jgi:hypothetical protein